MSWPLVTLPEICRPKQWPTIPKSKMMLSGYPVYGANGQIGYFSDYNHEEPTVLITCRGATCGTINVCEPKSYVTGNAMALDNLDESRIDLRFITYALKMVNFSNIITGVAQPQITRQSLAFLQIPLPPLAEQKRIAGILDTADALRAKRRATLDQLDILLQSIFLDMFGDSVNNLNGWDDKAKLGDLSEIVSGITKGRKTNGVKLREVPYLAVANVQDRHLKLDVVKKIAATDAEIEKYALKPGDLLLTEGGDPDKLGRGSLWKGEIPECIHQNHIFRVRLTDNSIDPIFLNWIVGSERGKRFFLRSAKQTTGIASINMKQLKGFPILRPPIDLQRRFAAIVEAVERQKNRMRAHLVELDNLFASLQSRAFKGEL